METTLLAALVCLSAAFIQSVTGFGAGLISMAFLSMLWPVHFATLLMAPLGLLLTSSLTWRLREHIDLGDLKPLIFGLPFGVGLGLLSYEQLPIVYLRKGLGGLLLYSALHHGFLNRWTYQLPKVFGPCFGILSGVTGVSLNSPGPPAIIYGSLMQWPPHRFRANLSAYFLMSGCSTVCLLAVRGHFTTDSLGMSALLAPALLIGVWLGSALADHLPLSIFKGFTLILLFVLGLFFILK